MEINIFDEAGGAAYMKAKAYLQLAEPFAEMRAQVDLIKRGEIHEKISPSRRLELDARLSKAFRSVGAYAYFFKKPKALRELFAAEPDAIGSRLLALSESFYDLCGRSASDQAKGNRDRGLEKLCAKWLAEEDQANQDLGQLLAE